MTKVLHLLSSNQFSGAENVVCQIIGAFPEKSVDFIYVSPEGPIREKLEARQIRFVPVKYLNIPDLQRIVKEEKPDIIHAHDMLASLFATIAIRKIPVVSQIHNNNFGFKGIKPFLMASAYCVAASRASHIFWVSEAAYNGFRYKNLYKKKSSVLYNVININALYEKLEWDKVEYDYDIIFLGRLSYPKNPERVLNVVKKIKEKKDNIKVAFVGTGELESEIKKLADEMQLTNNIDFFGFVSNPYKILKGSSVMLMTSRWEGLPMCALEAMALGVPIVSTPTDGLCEVIEDGENGYLRKTDTELADKIEEILNNSELRKHMSESAYKKSVKINSIEQYREEIQKVYNSAVLK